MYFYVKINCEMDKFIVVGKTLSEIEEFMIANEQ